MASFQQASVSNLLGKLYLPSSLDSSFLSHFVIASSSLGNFIKTSCDSGTVPFHQLCWIFQRYQLHFCSRYTSPFSYNPTDHLIRSFSLHKPFTSLTTSFKHGDSGALWCLDVEEYTDHLFVRCRLVSSL